MNQFSLLEGLGGSDDINDYVKKPKQASKPQPEAKAPVARKSNLPTKAKVNQQLRKNAQRGGAVNSTQSSDAPAQQQRKDVRGGPNRNKPFDRSRAQPKRGRQFDRNTAPGKGSRAPKKSGGGAHNWGRPGDQAIDKEEVPLVQQQPTITEEETPTTEPQTNAPEKKEEEEDKNITLDEYFKSKKPANLSAQKQRVQVDDSNLDPKLKKEKIVPLQKKEEQVVVLKPQKQSSQSKAHKKKNTIDLAEILADAPEPSVPRSFERGEGRGGFRGGRGRGGRGGRGNGRGRGNDGRGGRGGRGGGRGGGFQRRGAPAPNVNNQADFPSLS